VLSQLIDEGAGPTDIPGLFQRLIARLVERMADVVNQCDEGLDDIEERLEEGSSLGLRAELADLRRQIIMLRRYMAPQREALNRILADPPSWLGERERLGFRETADAMQRYVEELDAGRERAAAAIDEIATRLAEAMNRNMYLISIVALIFLPLGFLTGLLGINVGGMPGVEDDRAFWITCGLIAALLAVELVILRRLKLI